MKAIMSADRSTITMRGKSGWRQSFPAADLPRKLAFYRALRDRGGRARGVPGPYAQHYEPAIKALERLQDRVTP